MHLIFLPSWPSQGPTGTKSSFRPPCAVRMSLTRDSTTRGGAERIDSNKLSSWSSRWRSWARDPAESRKNPRQRIFKDSEGPRGPILYIPSCLSSIRALRSRISLLRFRISSAWLIGCASSSGTNSYTHFDGYPCAQHAWQGLTRSHWRIAVSSECPKAHSLKPQWDVKIGPGIGNGPSRGGI